jgi:uncharacterized RDD family membrane protein YckC
MQTRSRNLFISVLVALAFTLVLATLARAQPPPPEPAAPPAAAAVNPPEAAPAQEDKPAEARPPAHKRRADRHRGSSEASFGNHTVAAGVDAAEMVSILGNSTLDGNSSDAVVSILGDTTINGKAGDAAVAVLGNVKVNGEVADDVVAVLGNVTLGPAAVVHGDVVVVGGALQRDPAAAVHGSVQEINFFGHGADFGWFKIWLHHCAMLGRPLAFHAGLGWLWILFGSIFAFYVLLALLFPRAFDKCAETFEQRPGYSLLAVLLTVLITPVLIVLLVATGVGIVMLPFLIVGLFCVSLFGKAVMHAWLGRRVTRYFGDGPMKHAAVATLLGSVMLLLLYTVPFLGFFLWKALDVLGLGVVIYTLILRMRREKASPVVPPVAPVPPRPGPDAPLGAEFNPEAAAAPVPPVIPVSALPRAGFWIRLAASLLDTVIVGVAVGLTHAQPWFVLVFMAYCMVLWALKGTTIGGSVCGLKVVRLDERKVDWMVAIVRALAGFLSLAVAGLGFVWVAFDRDRQSWHDKIAGTLVVRPPKGVSLL